MEETKTISFPLRSWLDNAGIVGMMRILDLHPSSDDLFKLNVDSSCLDGFTDKFFDFFVNNYDQFAYYHQIVNKEGWLEDLKAKEGITANDINALANWFDNGIKPALLGKGKTFKQVADFLLEKYNDNFDLINKAESCKANRRAITIKKKNNDIESIKTNFYILIDKCLEIINYLKQPNSKRYYPAKYIGFRVIANGWTKTSFLDVANLAKSGKDIYENFTNFFVKPVQQYLQADHSEDEYSCAVCNRPIAAFDEKKKLSFPITFVNGMGYNFGAKTNNGWNFQNDLYICPICHLLYACVPAGFTYNMSSDAKGIFINESLTVEKLKDANDAIFNETMHYLEHNQNISEYRMFINTFEKKFADAQSYPLANVQLITYDANLGYDFKIISNLASVVLNQASDIMVKTRNDTDSQESHYTSLLNSLKHTGIKNYHGEFYYSIFDKIIRQIFNNTVLDGIIYTMERLLASQDQRIRYSTISINRILRLNSLVINELFKEKGEKNMTVDSEKLRKLSYWGFNARQGYKNKGNEKKAQTLAYKMLGALRVKDTDSFMSLLLNTYLYLGRVAPSVFIENQNNKEVFTQYGYAFVAGLLDSGNKKEN